MKFFTSRHGFTIIELLVVVAIIGILTSIMVSNFGESKKKSRDAKRVSDIVQLQLALELYFDRCNQYPVVGANTMPDLNAINGCPTGSNIKLGTFIGTIPTPPTAGDYRYGVNDASTPTDYMLHAKLESYNQALLDNPTAALYGSTCSSVSPYYFCAQPR